MPLNLLDAFVARTRLSWFHCVVCLSLLLTAGLLGVVVLDDLWTALQRDGFWRLMLLSPVLTIYYLLMYPLLRRSRENIISVSRSLTDLTEDEFQQIIARESARQRRREWIAFGGGCLFGLVLRLGGVQAMTWLAVYSLFTEPLFWSVLFWLLYFAWTSTSLLKVLSPHITDFNLFDPVFIKPVAQQSINVLLMLTGGMTIATLIIPIEGLLNPFSLIIYAGLILVMALMFLQAMRSTHQLLAKAKQRELDRVRQRLWAGYQQLTAGDQQFSTSASVQAWLAYEQRLHNVPEWPFSIDTLSKFIGSVLIPAGSVVGRAVWQQIT